MWTAKPKVFATWIFREKFSFPLPIRVEHRDSIRLWHLAMCWQIGLCISFVKTGRVCKNIEIILSL